MRPVDKGVAPNAYTTYQDAAGDLQSQLGDFCSYCERQIETNLAIEHIQPKSLVPTLQTSWANFLLACVHCNSCKSDTPINLPDFLWPDCDNTLRAIKYSRGGIVSVDPNLPAPIQVKAKATIELTGLDKDPGHLQVNRRPTDSDRRWKRRQEIWQLAEHNRNLLANNDSPEVRELIVQSAAGRGMFSIWWTVFDGDQDMRMRLRQAFLGTSPGCFDANENVQPRVNGQV